MADRWQDEPAQLSTVQQPAGTDLRCPTCGCNLTGLTITRCPECGNDFEVLGGYDYWRSKNSFYYQELTRLFRRHVPPRARVLEIGCQAGDLLADLNPACAAGVEQELLPLARERHPEFNYYRSLNDIPRGQTFDFILISNALADMHDVQAVLTAARRFCHSGTRIVLSYYNALWEPALRLASRLGLRRPTGAQNWLSRFDLENLLLLSGFETIRQFSDILLPRRVPLLHGFLNRFVVKFWPFRHLALQVVTVARPSGGGPQDGAASAEGKSMAEVAKDVLCEPGTTAGSLAATDATPRPPATRGATVSVIIPTRNERGNVQAAIERTPDMGVHTELIFVDGWSTDGTPEEIRRCMAAYPDRDIRLIAQEGAPGKGQAVRQGFAAARGDLLMILDADLTVAPEDLPKFYNAIMEGKGEFINGTRLVYPMEDEAMRFLNKLGNRFFSVLFTWLIGQRFRDTLCGTKVLARSNYERIVSTRAEIGLLDPFGDFDLIFGAARNDLKILEVPVRYSARRYGQTNIARFRDGWLLLRMSWKAFWKLRLR